MSFFGKELTARLQGIAVEGQIIGARKALEEVLRARDLADARGGIESFVSMLKLRLASLDVDAQDARDGLRILADAELDAATKRLDSSMVAEGAISEGALACWDVVES